MNKLDTLGQNFAVLTDEELMVTQGGSWPGEGLVRAIFDIGRETGRAIRHAFGG